MTNFEEYKTHDLWDLRELKALCCGIQPNGTNYEPFIEELNNAEERIRRACFAGTLSFKSPIDSSTGDRLYGHDWFFIPADAVRWAIPLFPKFPKELHGLSEQTQAKYTFSFGRDSNDYPPNQSDKLRYLNQASRLFWGNNVDRDDKTTYPKTKEIEQWFREKEGFGEGLAKKAATIIRPTWAKPGRPPEK